MSLPAYKYLWLTWIACDTKDVRNQVTIKAENEKQFQYFLTHYRRQNWLLFSCIWLAFSPQAMINFHLCSFIQVLPLAWAADSSMLLWRFKTLPLVWFCSCISHFLLLNMNNIILVILLKDFFRFKMQNGSKPSYSSLLPPPPF